MNKIRFGWAKYFALVTITIEWGAFIIIPDLFVISSKLPISQVSSIDNPAKPLVLVIMPIAAISYAIAALYFNNFYKKSLNVCIFAGICFSLTMFFPYNKGGWAWIHLILAFTCMLLYVYLIYATSRSTILKYATKKLFRGIYAAEILLLFGVMIFRSYSPQLVLILEILMVAGIHLWTLVLIGMKNFRKTDLAT